MRQFAQKCYRDASKHTETIQKVRIVILPLGRFGGVALPNGWNRRLFSMLRGTNGATVKDIVDLRKYLHETMSAFERRIEERREPN
eukprot:4685499-Amphidinium_carterae.1